MALLFWLFVVGVVVVGSVEGGGTAAANAGADHLHAWVVELNPTGLGLDPAKDKEAMRAAMERIAAQHGLHVIDQLSFKPEAFHVEEHECSQEEAESAGSEMSSRSSCRLRRSDAFAPVAAVSDRLNAEQGVLVVSHQQAKQRIRKSSVSKRSSLGDPLWSKQWYLKNSKFPSIHSTPVWDSGITGRCVSE